MENSKWLAGAFDAYGIASNNGKARIPTLLTTSDNKEYCDRFRDRTGFGRVLPHKGRYQWLVNDPTYVQQFYEAVAPHLTTRKRELIESAWEEWRQHVLTMDEHDVGPIDKPLDVAALP